MRNVGCLCVTTSINILLNIIYYNIPPGLYLTTNSYLYCNTLLAQKRFEETLFFSSSYLINTYYLLPDIQVLILYLRIFQIDMNRPDNGRLIK